MTDLGNLLSDNFPSTFDKTDKSFKALIANCDVDDINEFTLEKLGLMERVLYDAEEYVKKLFKTTDFVNMDYSTMDNLEKYLFEHFVKLFCIDKIRYFETSRILILTKLLFQRDNGLTGWGTKKNVEYIFSKILNCEAYIIENSLAYSDSLILNGDFEYQLSSWTSNVEKPISDEFPFCGNYSALLGSNQNVAQTVKLSASQNYDFMFFLMGTVNVYLKNNNNEYWDSKTKTWTTTETYTTLQSSSYQNVNVSFRTPDEDTAVVFEIVSAVDSSYVDYVRLFNMNYPCFDILIRGIVLEDTTGDNLTYGPKSESGDPVPDKEDNYDTVYGYLNKGYLSSTDSGLPEDLQELLIDYLRAAGVKGVCEKVTINESKLEAYVDGTTLVVPYGRISDTTFVNNETITDKTFNA